MPRGSGVAPQKASPASTYPIHPDVQVMTFSGPLFFVGTENLRSQIRDSLSKPILVLDLSDVPTMDETGALALKDLADRLQREGKSLYIGGLKQKSLRMLTRMGLVGDLGRSRVCKGLRSALRRASQEAMQIARAESKLCPQQS
jgi:SulP family sulfate permease